MYDSWDTTLELIGEMIDHEPNLWLIDNHSPNDRTQEAQGRFPNLRVIRTSYNGGWAAGYNHALRLAALEGYSAAYLLNSDALPERGAIDHALAVLESRTSAAAVGSVVVSMDGQKLEYDGEHRRAWPRPDVSTLDPDVRSVLRVHGAAMAVSLHAFERVGAFCEDYFMYHEETDWGLRALERGFGLYVDGSSRVRHMDGGSDKNGTQATIGYATALLRKAAAFSLVAMRRPDYQSWLSNSPRYVAGMMPRRS